MELLLTLCDGQKQRKSVVPFVDIMLTVLLLLAIQNTLCTRHAVRTTCCAHDTLCTRRVVHTTRCAHDSIWTNNVHTTRCAHDSIWTNKFITTHTKLAIFPMEFIYIQYSVAYLKITVYICIYKYILPYSVCLDQRWHHNVHQSHIVHTYISQIK